ncbi:MAG TPA: DUF1501 domain-containing protein [Chloroflexota bacterium]|nr:DUF1501 domain-containing protein [Chloroflexota bacterium]
MSSCERKNQTAHDFDHRRHAFSEAFFPNGRNLVHVGSRRWFLQLGAAGLATGMTAGGSPAALRRAAGADTTVSDRRAVIVFWLSGGPSHIDMWDPKPAAPVEIRGPYSPIATSVPGITVCEHLPLQAGLMRKLSIIRSVDCSASNHTPITMQAGNALARRTDDGNDGGGYPSMGSVAANFRGPNATDLPAFVGLADSWKADVWGAGHLGQENEPVRGGELAGTLKLVDGINVARLQDRRELRRQFDRLNRQAEGASAMRQVDRNHRLAFTMLDSGRVRDAFDIAREPDRLRDAYGRESVGEKALLARRLVEAGVTFVLVSGRWGYFDHHGDNVPPWGGIQKGLTPILPTIDRAMHSLVTDLDARGMLDSTLVLMMGEFGRTPVLSSDGGRGHWTNCMSMIVAGGGLPAGQVVGSTDSKGYTVKDGLVRPADLAATVFRHLRIDLASHWVNPQGRPIPIVTDGGRPIPELS